MSQGHENLLESLRAQERAKWTVAMSECMERIPKLAARILGKSQADWADVAHIIASRYGITSIDDMTPEQLESYLTAIWREEADREDGERKQADGLLDDLPDDLRRLIDDLPPDDEPGLRPAYRRDHLWLKWNKSGERFGPAKIRDRWNEMTDAHRKAISPRLPNMVGRGPSGAATVKEGLRKACAEEQKARKSKTSRKPASSQRSRKKR